MKNEDKFDFLLMMGGWQMARWFSRRLIMWPKFSRKYFNKTFCRRAAFSSFFCLSGRCGTHPVDPFSTSLLQQVVIIISITIIIILIVIIIIILMTMLHNISQGWMEMWSELWKSLEILQEKTFFDLFASSSLLLDAWFVCCIYSSFGVCDTLGSWLFVSWMYLGEWGSPI